MMLVEHWTDRKDFNLAAIDTAGEGAGLFVYLRSSCDAEESERARAWHSRRLVLLEVPADAVQEVQRFAAGEFCTYELVELFVPAARFADVEVL